MNADETLVAPPKQNAIKVIPKNCTSKEVLAVVKASMREVSEWLVAVERLETRKQAYDDQDLDRSGKTDIADEIDMNVLLSDEIAPPHSFQPYDNDDYIDDDETVFSESPPGYTSNIIHCLLLLFLNKLLLPLNLVEKIYYKLQELPLVPLTQVILQTFLRSLIPVLVLKDLGTQLEGN